ncbi:hypothetical protein BaRGS_00023206, partial [Batillaria attramentaria]
RTKIGLTTAPWATPNRGAGSERKSTESMRIKTVTEVGLNPKQNTIRKAIARVKTRQKNGVIDSIADGREIK